MKKIHQKINALECSKHFSHKTSIGFLPDAQEQLTLQSEVSSGQISNPFKTLWLSLLPARMKNSQWKIKALVWSYEGCSNMNASSFITFFTYMQQQNGKRFYKGLYVTFKLAPDIKKNTVYLSSYSHLNECYVSILTNSMLWTYTSDIDERIILW